METGDGTVDLRVCDHGQGIAETELEKIFVPFEKLSARPTAGEKSTGIGPAIVKRIVDAHGGRNGVQIKKGDGARFTLSLPVG
ncbi:MAG: HAMP domain-containing sensor histidine kinase [Rhodospirillaceae bacterium]